MIRVFRLINAFILALLAVVLTLVALLYFNASWQKSLLMEILKTDSAREYSVGEFQVKTSSVNATDIFILQGGYGVEIKRIALASPMWRLLLGEVLIQRGEFNQVLVDLSSLRIADPTALDWQEFLTSLRTEDRLWNQRIGQWVQTLGSQGVSVEIQDLAVDGILLLPGGEHIEFDLLIHEALSEAPNQVRSTIRITPPNDGEELPAG